MSDLSMSFSSFRRILLLDGVTLPSVQNVIFQGQLHKIQLTRCNVKFIGQSMFTRVQNLQALDLGQNLIEHLEPDSFSGLNRLVTIALENNYLTHLPIGLFDGMDRLSHVLLRGNRLESIAAATFSHLFSLKEIDLSGNHLRHVSDEAMGRESSDFTQLTNIDLSDNELQDFPIWLLKMRFLTDVDLSDNQIAFAGFKQTLSRIQSGDYIRQSNTHSTSSSENIYLPAYKKTIKFLNNAITDFDIAKFTKQELLNFKLVLNYFQLDFGGTGFHCNCRTYDLYNYLRSFDRGSVRDYNRIGVLPFNMDSMTCQLPLEVQGRPLVDVPITTFGCIEEVTGCPQHCWCWVRSLDGAVKVDCSNQSLTHLPEALPKGTIQLDFAANDVTSLELGPSFPDYFTSIEVLDMSNNQLGFLDGKLFVTKSSVTDLRSHGNKLNTMPTEVSLSEDHGFFSIDICAYFQHKILPFLEQIKHRHRLLSVWLPILFSDAFAWCATHIHMQTI